MKPKTTTMILLGLLVLMPTTLANGEVEQPEELPTCDTKAIIDAQLDNEWLVDDLIMKDTELEKQYGDICNEQEIQAIQRKLEAELNEVETDMDDVENTINQNRYDWERDTDGASTGFVRNRIEEVKNYVRETFATLNLVRQIQLRLDRIEARQMMMVEDVEITDAKLEKWTARVTAERTGENQDIPNGFCTPQGICMQTQETPNSTI